MSDYKVGIVVVTYNRLTLLQECLSCLQRQTRPFDKILVVNNASTDGTKEFLDNWQPSLSNVQVLHSPKNRGGAGGFCMGLDQLYPQVDYTVLIDDDAMLQSDYLQHLLATLQENCGAYSGTVVTQGKIDTEHRRRISNSILMRQKKVPVEEYEQDTFMYDASSFCGLMVSSKLVCQIGLPRADYFIWYDDTEYSLRLRKLTPILNVNKAQLNHKTAVSPAPAGHLSWKSFYGYRNQLDMGRTYSRFPWIYLAYRYTFHTIEMMIAVLRGALCADKRKRAYWKKAGRLHQDVIKAVYTKEMGLHPDYLPGKSLY